LERRPNPQAFTDKAPTDHYVLLVPDVLGWQVPVGPAVYVER
jgi:hypothetical protein